MSQQTLSTPNKLTLSGDNAQAWKSFKQRFELYVLAAGYTNKSDAEKIALLLTIGGDELIEIYNRSSTCSMGYCTSNLSH